MSSIDKLASELQNLINESNSRKPQPYDTDAQVVRVEGDTLWVHIPGGIEETPIKKTINAEVGDNIKVHVANGSAWISGNETAPPTDDRQANYATNIALIADGKAEDASNDAERARMAAEIAENAASSAVEDAGIAKKSATTAINQLGYIEDVVGTLNWIAEHGEYSPSTDTEVQDGKMYFNRISPEETIQQPYSENMDQGGTTITHNPVTINGITYTTNDDGSITANGTATAKSAFGIKRQNWTPYHFLEEEEYKLTGCPAGGSLSTYSMFATYGSGQADTNPKYGEDVGAGTVFTGRANERTGIWLVIQSGITVDNLVFNPSLTLNIADRYEVVTNPTGSPTEHGWFELTSVDEAVSNYVAAHLALTDEGLYVQTDREEGWRVLIKGNGVYIIDDEGDIVAEYKDEILLGKPTEDNVRINTDGFAIRDGNVELAKFADDKVTIGKSDEQHFELNGTTATFIDEYGLGQVNISQSDSSVQQEVTNIHDTPDACPYEITLPNNIISGKGILVYSTSIKASLLSRGDVGAYGDNMVYMFLAGTAGHFIQPEEGSGGTIAYPHIDIEYDGDKTITFNDYPDRSHAEAIYRLSYIADTKGWTVTFGSRDAEAPEGNQSLSVGYNNVVSGKRSFAFGNNLIARHNDEILFGQYNNENINNVLFAIGGGARSGATTTRKNVMTVVKTGDVEFSNTVTVKGDIKKGNYNVIHEGTATSTPTASITASVGTLSSVSVARWGKVVFMTLAVTNSNEVASGGNIFTGTLNTTALRPVSQVSGAAFVSARPIIGALADNGNIVVRNTSPTALTLGGPVYIPLVYLIP